MDAAIDHERKRGIDNDRSGRGQVSARMAGEGRCSLSTGRTSRLLFVRGSGRFT